MSDLPPLSSQPGLGNLGSPSGLGNLAQSARHSHLKGARIILIVIGLLTMLMNWMMLENSENEVKQVVDAEVAKIRAGGQGIDQAVLAQETERILTTVRLIYGGAVALGLVFVILGLMVYKFPVGSTVLGLVLYIGATAVFGFLNPASLVSGIIFKVIFIVGLAKAIKAAIVYQRETQELVGKPAAVGLGADL